MTANDARKKESPITKEWNMQFQKLSDHMVEVGFPRLIENLNGEWIENKEKYRQNKLHQIQIKKLETINGWVWQHLILLKVMRSLARKL